MDKAELFSFLLSGMVSGIWVGWLLWGRGCSRYQWLRQQRCVDGTLVVVKAGTYMPFQDAVSLPTKALVRLRDLDDAIDCHLDWHEPEEPDDAD